jgi:hypothetical protein
MKECPFVGKSRRLSTFNGSWPSSQHVHGLARNTADGVQEVSELYEAYLGCVLSFQREQATNLAFVIEIREQRNRVVSALVNLRHKECGSK